MDEPRFERCACAPGLKLQSHEKVTEIQHANILKRIDKVEEMIERIEKRLWLTVYGVVALILAEALTSVFISLP
jgi:hypothetical protein